jgi:hypothetical protein
MCRSQAWKNQIENRDMRGLLQRRISVLPKVAFTRTVGSRWVVITVLLLGVALRVHADVAIYTDSLVNGWAFQFSLFGSPDFNNLSPVHSGSDSIAITIPANQVQNAMMLSPNPPQIDATGYTHLSFWLNGGANGVDYISSRIGYFDLTTYEWNYYDTFNLAGAPAHTWQDIDIPLPSNEVQDPTKFALIFLSIGHGNYTTLPYDTNFYIDDMRLTAVPEPSAAALAGLGLLGAAAALRRKTSTWTTGG